MYWLCSQHPCPGGGAVPCLMSDMRTYLVDGVPHVSTSDVADVVIHSVRYSNARDDDDKKTSAPTKAPLYYKENI